MSNCPKCNKKLAPFYFKQNCPHCNANLMYYDFDNRLKEDADLAEKEWNAVEKIISGIKASVIGSVSAVARLIMFFTPIVALLMPTFKAGNETINLISIIKKVILASGDIFGNKALLLSLCAFAVAIIFVLVNLVVSLFSFTKNGIIRNIVISAIGIIAFAGVGIAAAVEGIVICNLGGFYVAIILMIITTALHIAVNKKIKAE